MLAMSKDVGESWPGHALHTSEIRTRMSHADWAHVWSGWQIRMQTGHTCGVGGRYKKPAARCRDSWPRLAQSA